MRSVISFVFVVCMTLLMACNGGNGDHGHNDHDHAHDNGHIHISDDQLAMEKDPVCGMTVSGEGIADTTMYEGKIYGFCNAACKKEFKQNPEKYLSVN